MFEETVFSRFNLFQIVKKLLLISFTGTMVDLGLPWPNFNLKWTIVCFNCYLIFSLNFVGLFAQGIPHRLNQGVRNHAYHTLFGNIFKNCTYNLHQNFNKELLSWFMNIRAPRLKNIGFWVELVWRNGGFCHALRCKSYPKKHLSTWQNTLFSNTSSTRASKATNFGRFGAPNLYGLFWRID